MTKFVGALFVFALIATGDAAQQGVAQVRSDTVEWDVKLRFLSASDKQDIVTLTRQLGFEPRRVIPWPNMGVLAPPGCEPVFVETAISVVGHRLDSKSISMLKVDERGWRECRPPSARPVTVGQWTAFSDEIRDDTHWRIEDAGFVLDVRLGPNASYEDARRIVLAIHQHRWTRSTPIRPGAPWKDPSSSTIQLIDRDSETSPEYEIYFSPADATEESWKVRLRDSVVEIVSYQFGMF